MTRTWPDLALRARNAYIRAEQQRRRERYDALANFLDMALPAPPPPAAKDLS